MYGRETSAVSALGQRRKRNGCATIRERRFLTASNRPLRRPSTPPPARCPPQTSAWISWTYFLVASNRPLRPPSALPRCPPPTDKCVDNVDMNLEPRGLAGKATVRRLAWDCAEELALFEPPYDMVIAGDCFYEEACISPLLKTMWALSGPTTQVGSTETVPAPQPRVLSTFARRPR